MSTQPRSINARVLKNSVALLGAQTYALITTFVLATQLPRYLGEGGYGLYGETYAFVGLFEVIGQMGLRLILTREVAQRKDQAASLLGQVLTMKLPLAGISFAIVMAATLIRPTTPWERILIAICAIESLILGFSNAISGVLRAFELMEYDLVVALVHRTLVLGGVLAAIYLQLDLAAVFLAFLVAGIGRLLVNALVCWQRLGRPRWGANLSLWRQLLKEAWPVGLSAAISRAYDGAGLVLLGVAGGATGLLTGALRINRLTDMVGVSVTEAVFPVLARSSTQSEHQLRHTARETLSLLMSLVFPVAAFYATFSDEFITWFMGPEFSDASAVLLILSPVLVSNFLLMFLASTLNASGQQRLVTLSGGIGLGINVLCNVLLIPQYGVLGPALALLISETTKLIAILLLTHRPLSPLDILRTLIPSALGATGMILVWRTVFALLPLVARVLAGGAIYCLVWSLLAMIDPRTRGLLQHLFAETTHLLKRRSAAQKQPSPAQDK
jgi:O-antigen/teichoic acid export membrane protein